jgi:hypothetical protein
MYTLGCKRGRPVTGTLKEANKLKRAVAAAAAVFHWPAEAMKRPKLASHRWPSRECETDPPTTRSGSQRRPPVITRRHCDPASRLHCPRA